MKRKLFYVMLSAVAVLASCTKGEDNSPKSADFNVTAATYSSGPQITWSVSDKIGLFSGESLYQLTATSAGATASFNGEVIKSSQYYAVSPYSSTTTFAEGYFSAKVPAAQTAVKGGVAGDACVSVATSSTTDLSFKAATSLLKLSLGSDNNIKAVKIVAKNGESLAGDASVSASDAKITVKNGSSEVTLSPSGSIFDKGTYYVAVIPATYVEGLDITLTDEYGRVCTVASEEFISSKAAATLDLGQVDASAEFVTPSLTSSPTDIAVKGDGETATTTLSSAFNSTSVINAPSWAKVSVSGSTVSAVVEASSLADDVRYGKIHIEGIASDGPARADIYIAQAAKGAKLVYDSFSGSSLSDNWKGNATRSSLSIGDGCLKMTGTGEYNSATNTYPLFYTGAQVRQKYNDSSCNQFVCTIDIKADGGCGGIIGFNAYGYKEDGTCDFVSKQNYITFISATEGSEGGGYYCFNCASANAMDNWSKPENTSVTTWLRLEMSNVDRGGDGVGGDWGLKAIWSLEEDENGVLQKKDLLFHGGMWWWNDSPQLGTQYGYFGIFSKDASETSFRNFTLSYQDNQ